MLAASTQARGRPYERTPPALAAKLPAVRCGKPVRRAKVLAVRRIGPGAEGTFPGVAARARTARLGPGFSWAGFRHKLGDSGSYHSGPLGGDRPAVAWSWDRPRRGHDAHSYPRRDSSQARISPKADGHPGRACDHGSRRHRGIWHTV